MTGAGLPAPVEVSVGLVELGGDLVDLLRRAVRSEGRGYAKQLLNLPAVRPALDHLEFAGEGGFVIGPDALL